MPPKSRMSTLSILLCTRYEAVCISGETGMGEGYFQAAPATWDDELGAYRTKDVESGNTGDTPEDAIEALYRAGEPAEGAEG